MQHGEENIFQKNEKQKFLLNLKRTMQAKNKRLTPKKRRNNMQIIRGTTPTITITVKSELDFTTIQQVWVYISQQNKVKIDKVISDVSFDPENKKIEVTLSQDDTLALKAGNEALFQIRLLLNNETALATVASKVTVIEVYKDGVIE